MRPDWDSYFLAIAFLTRLRSNCIKRKVGCVIVKNNIVVGLGYNGTPKNTTNCFDQGCERCNTQHQSSESHKGIDIDKCVCLHAELNAILAAKENLEECTLYSTLEPCINCSKCIVQTGIKRVLFIEKYNHTHSNVAADLFKQAKVQKQQKNMSIDTILEWEKS